MESRPNTSVVDIALPAATFIAILAAMWAVFLYVPTERTLGPVQRIFYVHMAMWLATFVSFLLVAVGSLLYLWRGDMAWDRLGRVTAELGLLFCTFGLATGSIWGRASWGAWWTWDPRLTLTLILWMIYAAYLLLRTLAVNPHQGANLAAILGITGVLDIYLIDRAVVWWRSMHPAVLRNTKPGSGLQDPRMWHTLGICMVAFFLLYLWLLRLRLQAARLQDAAEEMREELSEAR